MGKKQHIRVSLNTMSKTANLDELEKKRRENIKKVLKKGWKFDPSTNKIVEDLGKDIRGRTRIRDFRGRIRKRYVESEGGET